MLTVSSASGAADYYKRAFGAVEVSRAAAPSGQLVIEMRIERETFFVVDENKAAFNVSPSTLKGTTVRLSLIVDDPDAAEAKAVAEGGTVVFPVADQPYGMRQGRVADPYGHHWLIGKML
jgi:PhnB protein